MALLIGHSCLTVPGFGSIPDLARSDPELQASGGPVLRGQFRPYHFPVRQRLNSPPDRCLRHNVKTVSRGDHQRLAAIYRQRSGVADRDPDTRRRLRDSHSKSRTGVQDGIRGQFPGDDLRVNTERRVDPRGQKAGHELPGRSRCFAILREAAHSLTVNRYAYLTGQAWVRADNGRVKAAHLFQCTRAACP